MHRRFCIKTNDRADSDKITQLITPDDVSVTPKRGHRFCEVIVMIKVTVDKICNIITIDGKLPCSNNTAPDDMLDRFR